MADNICENQWTIDFKIDPEALVEVEKTTECGTIVVMESVSKHIFEGKLNENYMTKNVALILFTNQDQVLIVKEKFDLYGFIAGRIKYRADPRETELQALM